MKCRIKAITLIAQYYLQRIELIKSEPNLLSNKDSWKIVDDNRTNVRSRLKAMSVIKECYKYKTEMLGTERTLNQMNTLYKQILVKEKELTRRENALKAFLEGRKLTEDEIFRETNPNRAF